MTFISLWIMEHVFKTNIKDLKKGSNISKERLKALKRKLVLVRVLMGVVLAGGIVIACIVIVSLFSFTNTLSALAGNTIVTLLADSKDKDEDKDKEGWSWSKENDEDDTQSGVVTGPGGLYPKDPKLRLRAELLEILGVSVEDAKAEYGTQVEPAWLLGTMYRETNNSLFNVLDNSSVSSLYKDLLVHHPSCLWDLVGSGKCTYIKNGHSHFYGGSVSGGVDNGDPYTQVANSSESLYKSMGATGRHDHALGYVQFEARYLYDNTTEFNKMYKNPTPITSSSDPAKAQAEVIMDSDVGFIRPNILSIPDEMYNGAFSLADKPRRQSTSNYTPTINSAGFKALSEYNQNCLKFIYATSGYVRGSLTDADDSMVRDLINLANSSGLEHLDDILLDTGDKYWDGDKLLGKLDEGKFRTYVKKNYGVTFSSEVTAHGLYSAASGKLIYTKLKELIDNAEKDGVEEGTTGGTEAEPSVNKMDGLIEYAKTFLGTPYAWGGSTPAAFDCSGLTQYVFKQHFGIDITRTTYTQINQGTEVDLNALEVGDLLFFGSKSAPHHVAIYIGNDEFIHAPETGDVVKITKIPYYRPSSARRIAIN